MRETQPVVAVLFLLVVLAALPAMAAPPATPSTAPTQAVAPVVAPAIGLTGPAAQCSAPAAKVDDPLAGILDAKGHGLPPVGAAGFCTDRICFTYCGIDGGFFIGGDVPCICC